MSLRRSLSALAPYCAILIAAAVTVGGLRLQHEHLRKAAFVFWRQRMDASADATRAAVQSWLDRLQEDDYFLAQNTAQTPALFLAPVLHLEADSAISRLLTEFATESEYRGIWVLRANGTLITSSEGADSLPDAVRAAARLAARTEERQTVGPLRIHDDEQLFAVIEPVISKGRSHQAAALGAVVLAVDPYTMLFPTVLLEENGITHPRHRLVQHVGDDFVVLTPSDDPRAGPGEFRLPWSRTPSSGALAASGRDSSRALRGVDEIGRAHV